MQTKDTNNVFNISGKIILTILYYLSLLKVYKKRFTSYKTKRPTFGLKSENCTSFFNKGWSFLFKNKNYFFMFLIII